MEYLDSANPHLDALLQEPVIEPWHCDPKDKLGLSEEERQRAFLNDCRYVAPSLIIWSTPNAARRTRWEVAKAKREGMRTGALDLNIFWSGGCAIVEMKNGVDAPTLAQIDTLDALFRAGHNTGIFRTSVSLLNWLRDRGAPVRAFG